MLLPLLLSLFCLIIANELWKRWKYDLHKIPAPPAVPFLGHLPGLYKAGELTKFRGYWWKKLGCPKIMKISLAGKIFLNVSDMECVKSVILSKTAPLPKHSSRNLQIIALTGNNPHVKNLLYTSENTPYVKAIRKVYASGFHTKTLKAAYPKLCSVFSKTVDQIELKRKVGAVDFQELLTKMTLDFIGMVAFDSNLGGLDGTRPIHSLIIELGHETLQSRFRLFGKIRSLLPAVSPKDRDQKDKVACLTAEWEKLVKEILSRDDPLPEEEPMWHFLKNFIDPETKRPISRAGLLMEMATVVLAGMDTTGHQLAWILALLAANPQVTAKMISEFEEHGLAGPNSRMVALDDLGDLSYLTAVIKEAMRLTNAAAGTPFRCLPRDTTILGYRLPKGTMIVVPGDRCMSSEADWPDPDVFRPERWLANEDMSSKFYLGFSYGPRDCIGQKLAMVEMRLALVYLLVRYEFSLTVPFDELMANVRNGVAVEARDGIWLNVKPRADQIV